LNEVRPKKVVEFKLRVFDYFSTDFNHFGGHFLNSQHDVLPNLQEQKTRTHLTIWRSEAPTIVVFTKNVHFVNEDITLIFERFINLNMYNTAIIFWPTIPCRYQIFTFNRFLDTRLENKTGAKTFQDIFYDKYANMHGKTLRITQYDHPIQSYVHNETFISGTDGLALALLCKKMNATYRVVGPKGPKELAEAYTTIDLDSGTADISFNKRPYLNKNNLNSTIIPVYPHEIDSIVILVPKAGPYLSYQNLLQPFKPTSRFVLMAVFLFVATVWFLFQQYYRNARPQMMNVLLDTLRLQLATSLPRTIVNFHERLLICGFMVYGFIIITSYQTILISLLASPHHQPDMQTLAELNRTNFVVYALNSINRLRGMSHLPLHMQNQVIETNITLLGLKNSRLAGTNFGYMTTNRAAGFLFTSTNNTYNGRPWMHMIDEGIFFSPATYRLPWNSPYEPVISRWISWFRAAGLYRKFYWDTFFEGKRKDRLNIGEPTGSTVRTTTGVQFSEVEPAFLLLGFGCAIASVVFVVEVVYYRIVKATKRMFGWRMRACSHCGAPKFIKTVKLYRPTENEVEGVILPWVN
jgi:hypothetical protein